MKMLRIDEIAEEGAYWCYQPGAMPPSWDIMQAHRGSRGWYFLSPGVEDVDEAPQLGDAWFVGPLVPPGLTPQRWQEVEAAAAERRAWGIPD